MITDKGNMTGTILWMSLRMLANVVLLLILVEGFVSAYHFSYKVFADIPYMAASSDIQRITIQPGTDAGEIATVLDEMGIVEGKYLFLARVYLGKYDDRIIAGTYSLGPGMTPDEICRRICGIRSEDAT